MRAAAVALSIAALLSSCKRENPEDIVGDYLSAIEQGRYRDAYYMIDNISRQNLTHDQFENYWRAQAQKFGSPVSHEIYDSGLEKGTYVVDYFWRYDSTGNPPPEFFQKTRSYHLRLKRDFQGWRIRFLKYKIKKEPKKPKGGG